MDRADPSAQTSGRIELRLVGRPQLRRADGEWLDLFPHEALVLAMVAIDGPQTRADIASRFWPGGGERTNLRQCLFQLARRARDPLLLADRNTLALRPGVLSDVGGGFAGAQATLSTDELFGALVLPPRLPRAGKTWIEQARDKWWGARMQAFERQTELLQATDEPRAAAALLDDLLAVDPMHEHLWCQRMRIQAHLQGADGARAIFERWCEILRTKGRVPAAETVAALDCIETARGSAGAAAALSPPLLARAPFVGRQAEMRLMRHAWDRGAAFVLVGDAGIGKSTLLQHFLAGQDHMLLVEAIDGDALHPYALALNWLQACRERWGLPDDERCLGELSRLLPDLGPAPEAAGHEALLQSALLAVLRHAAGRGLAALVVDDLQFADGASVRVLQRCLASAPGLRMGLAMRDPGRRDAGDPLPALLRAGARVEVITMPGLSVSETRELMRGLRLDTTGLVSRAEEFVAHCGGNPWYLLDTLRDHLARGDLQAPLSVPGSVGRWTEMQLQRLSAPARVLAWLAATAGPDHDLALAALALARAQPQPLPLSQVESAWRELQAAQVLQGDTFAHGIVRQAVARDVPEAVARQMHGWIAAGLLARGGATPQQLVRHHAGAGCWAEAAQAAEALAAESERLGQRQTQLVWLDSAAQWYGLAQMPDAAQRVGTAALGPCVEHEGAEAALARAERLAATAATPAQRACLDAERARIALRMGDVDAAIVHARSALDDGAGPGDNRALAVSVLAISLAWRGQNAQALQLIEPAVEQIASVGSDAVRQDLWSSYALVLAHDECWRRVVPVVERGLEDALSSRNRAAAANLHNSLSTALASLGQGAAALDPACRAHDAFAAMDAPEYTRVSAMSRARALSACGRYAEAIAMLQDVLQSSARDPDAVLYLSTVENALAANWLALGCTDRARLLIAADTPPQPVLRRLTRLVLRARVALQDESDAAPALCRQALAAAERGVNPMQRLQARLMLAASLPPARALADAREALALAEEGDNPVLGLLARLRHAQALLRCGRPAPARDEALAALAASGAIQHALIHPPELWLTAALACRAVGDRAAARQHRDAGRKWLRDTADAHLPPGCREAFFHRHPVHRALLADGVDGPPDRTA